MKQAEIDEKIKNYCMTAIAYGKRLKKPLDGSIQGALNLEKIFEVFHRDLYGSPMKQLIRKLTGKTLTYDHIKAMASILGAYLGELIRAKLGEECKWEVAPDDAGKIGELNLIYKDTRIFPMDKAFQRLLKGRSENTLEFYKSFHRS